MRRVGHEEGEMGLRLQDLRDLGDKVGPTIGGVEGAAGEDEVDGVGVEGEAGIMGGGDDEWWRAGIVDDDAEAYDMRGWPEDTLGDVVAEQGSVEVDNPKRVASAQGLRGRDVDHPPGGCGKGDGWVEWPGVGVSGDGKEGPIEEAVVGGWR
jgi:hypothetical protein